MGVGKLEEPFYGTQSSKVMRKLMCEFILPVHTAGNTFDTTICGILRLL